jgi:thymidylate synthase
MYQNFVFSGVNDALPALCRTLTRNGEEVGSRNGRVMDLTHVGVTLNHPWRREILLDHRRPNIAAQIAETMWVLSGRDDMDFLTKYLPRAAEFSDDGLVWRGAYGPRLRSAARYFKDDVDQWAHVINLLREDPLTRRAVAAIYDPTIDTEDGKDIPCNDLLMFTSRLGYLDLQVAVRSNDLIWGWSGINAFEWSAMLEITAGLLGLKVGSLHFSTASLHLYDHHWSKAEKVATDLPPEGLEDSPRFAVPRGVFVEPTLAAFDELADEWFRVEAMIRERSALAADDAVLDFPEPMLRSWLRVLQWWWSGDHQYLRDIAGTRLEYATHVSVQPPARAAAPRPASAVAAGPLFPKPEPLQPQSFVTMVQSLHDQKHAAYGDSWKKRGEMLGIMANIARKVDRLGGSATDDETSADTAMDLMIYLAKYRCWIFDQDNGTTWSDSTSWANKRIQDTADHVRLAVKDTAQVEQRLRDLFAELEVFVTSGQGRERARIVDLMLSLAYALAQHLWDQQQGDDYRGADHD